MNDSFRSATGRKVVSRASAEELGRIGHLLIDHNHQTIAAVVVGRGRKAMLADWDHFIGFGPDAAILDDEGALHQPGTDREQAAADGTLDLVGKRALSETGNEVGTVDDVTFDPDTGLLNTLVVSGHHVDTAALLGAGAYAAVLAATVEEKL